MSNEQFDKQSKVLRDQLVEKVCFFKKVLVLNPYPQTPFPGKGAILLGLPPLDQARMLAVSHTKPLHDAVAQMADDLYGGFAPATPNFKQLRGSSTVWGIMY